MATPLPPAPARPPRARSRPAPPAPRQPPPLARETRPRAPTNFSGKAARAATALRAGGSELRARCCAAREAARPHRRHRQPSSLPRARGSTRKAQKILLAGSCWHLVVCKGEPELGTGQRWHVGLALRTWHGRENEGCIAAGGGGWGIALCDRSRPDTRRRSSNYALGCRNQSHASKEASRLLQGLQARQVPSNPCRLQNSQKASASIATR